ncbi:hypothetical protein NQ317_000325, partial [Molorchus minor]
MKYPGTIQVDLFFYLTRPRMCSHFKKLQLSLWLGILLYIFLLMPVMIKTLMIGKGCRKFKSVGIPIRLNFL